MIGHPYDEIESFALGDLDQTVAARVLDHADACPQCAVLLAEAMAGTAALASGEGERALPADLGRRIAAAATSSTSTLARARSRRPNLAYFAAGLAAAAAVVMGIWNLDLRSGAPSVPIALLVHSHFQHHELRRAAGASGTGSAKVIQAIDGAWVYVVADGLAPRAGYELWELRDGSPARAGEFVTDDLGRAARYWEQSPGPIRKFIVARQGLDPNADTGALRWP